MWKRSFIFLVASVLVVSSLCAYPAFFYGGAKEAPAVVEEEAETSTEVSEKSMQDLTSSKEESAPEVSDRSEWSDTKSVVELLEEARVKTSVIEKVKEACFLIDEGRNEMVVAYNAEVEKREKAEKEAERIHYVVMPIASYKPSLGEWGVGLALGIETKSLVLQIQALKPITAGLDSVKAWDDVTFIMGAGFRF